MDDNAVISICYPECFATALMCDFQEDILVTYSNKKRWMDGLNQKSSITEKK